VKPPDPLSTEFRLEIRPYVSNLFHSFICQSVSHRLFSHFEFSGA
jgi:hypothetical protein